MQNQYVSPEYAEILAELKAKRKEQRAELNETDEAYPDLQQIIDANWK